MVAIVDAIEDKKIITKGIRIPVEGGQYYPPLLCFKIFLKKLKKVLHIPKSYIKIYMKLWKVVESATKMNRGET